VRDQVPLKLAWASTCHSGQGSEFDLLVFDCVGCWDDGHAYTGVSRARELLGFEMRHFKANLVRADPLVLEFYEVVKMGSQSAMDMFLRERAGMWWYPLLNHHELLSMLCHTCEDKENRVKGAESKQFLAWLKKYGPNSSYSGWSAPENETDVSSWRKAALGASTAEIAFRSHFR
jgi:hypothetical protein